MYRWQKETVKCWKLIEILIKPVLSGDPVPFWRLDPGSGMGKKNQDPDPGWSYFRSLKTIFWNKIIKFCDAMWIRIRDPEIFLTLDPGSGIRDGKNSDLVFGINIPDPQHWIEELSKENRTKKQNLTLLSLHREKCRKWDIYWRHMQPDYRNAIHHDGARKGKHTTHIPGQLNKQTWVSYPPPPPPPLSWGEEKGLNTDTSHAILLWL